MIPETRFAVAIHDKPSGEFELYIVNSDTELGALRESLDKLPKDKWSDGEKRVIDSCHCFYGLEGSQTKSQCDANRISY